MKDPIVMTMSASLLLALSWSGAALADEGEIYRAQFTTAVENHEPVDEVTELGTDHDRVLFFMEVRNMENHTLTHRYSHEGDVEAEVELAIGGPRWRTWSSKRLIPDWEGEWTVEVVDEEGTVHGSWSFDYSEAHAIDYMEESEADGADDEDHESESDDSDY